MMIIFEALMMILGLARFVILIYFAMSWLINFQVLNLRQPMVGQVWYWLHRITEPVFTPLRRVIPQVWGLDFTPVVVLLAITLLESLLAQNVWLFY